MAPQPPQHQPEDPGPAGSVRQKQFLQVAEKIKAALGGAHPYQVALNQAFALGLVQCFGNGRNGQAGALGEVLQRKTLPQAQRVQHVFKWQVGAAHFFVLRHGMPRQGVVHVAARIAKARLAHHAVGKAQLAVRAR